MTRRRYGLAGHRCVDPDLCCHCEYVAEAEAHERDLEPADPQRELEAADREAGMGRWS